MRIEFIKSRVADTLARWAPTESEFFMRADGSVWHRNSLRPDDICFVCKNEATFREAAAALNGYWVSAAKTSDESKQLVYVRLLSNELRALGLLCGSPESFWPLIVEQAETGML